MHFAGRTVPRHHADLATRGHAPPSSALFIPRLQQCINHSMQGCRAQATAATAASQAPTTMASRGQEPSSKTTSSPAQPSSSISAPSDTEGIQPDVLIVNTIPLLQRMLHEMQGVEIIAVDCEGVRLGRPGGRLCLVQMSCRKASAPLKVPLSIYLVDIVELGAKAFSTVYMPPASPAVPSSSGNSSSSSSHTASSGSSSTSMDSTVANSSIKAIFEGKNVTKYLFDVRGDSEALSSEFRVKFVAAYDLQLAEVALRQSVGEKAEHVMGLDKCLARYCTRTTAMTEDLMASHYVSKRYHVTNLTQVWAVRPLTPELVRYAASDVRYMHSLADSLNKGLSKDIIEKVKKHTVTRITVKDHSGTTPRSQAPEIVNTSRSTPPTAARDAAKKTNATDSRFPWLFAALLVHHDEAQQHKDTLALNIPTTTATTTATSSPNSDCSPALANPHNTSSPPTATPTPTLNQTLNLSVQTPGGLNSRPIPGGLNPGPGRSLGAAGVEPRAPELMSDAATDLLMVYYLQRASELPLESDGGGDAADAVAWLAQAQRLVTAFQSSAGVPQGAAVKASSITSSQLVRPPPRRV